MHNGLELPIRYKVFMVLSTLALADVEMESIMTASEKALQLNPYVGAEGHYLPQRPNQQLSEGQI